MLKTAHNVVFKDWWSPSETFWSVGWYTRQLQWCLTCHEDEQQSLWAHEGVTTAVLEQPAWLHFIRHSCSLGLGAAAPGSCVLTSLAVCAGAAGPLCRDYVIADPPFPSLFFFSFCAARGFWQTHASSHEGAFVFFFDVQLQFTAG